ncbi:hypothetical protein QR680_003592 [Steinernema hermaphroditum]|uniref:Skp1-related protein n=1 Tax=Steinernema hermaphroditum TaxID=289476 RepID=A0AA39HKW8_9BILA|nr:hypothetical protein QR680_003592 [Steinernema hermaphroditum]
MDAEAVYSIVPPDNSEPVKITEQALFQSAMLKELVTTLGDAAKNEPIPYTQNNTPRFIIEKVVEWCEQHKTETLLSLRFEQENSEESKHIELPRWDREFLSSIDSQDDALYHLTAAANYLEIGKLYRYCCKFIYDNHVKGKNVDEIRRYFHETDDFTPEEKKQLEEENKWFT